LEVGAAVLAATVESGGTVPSCCGPRAVHRA